MANIMNDKKLQMTKGRTLAFKNRKVESTKSDKERVIKRARNKKKERKEWQIERMAKIIARLSKDKLTTTERIANKANCKNSASDQRQALSGK